MDKDLLEQYFIRPALEYLNMISQSAINLLLGTVAQESAMGQYVSQIGGGPAIGIYQIEPSTHRDVYLNYLDYRKELRDKIILFRVGQTMDDHLRSSIFYQTLIARLIYYRTPDALPAADDLNGLARYWKFYYNTMSGDGTADQFIFNYKRYINNI